MNRYKKRLTIDFYVEDSGHYCMIKSKDVKNNKKMAPVYAVIGDMASFNHTYAMHEIILDFRIRDKKTHIDLD